MENKEYTLDRYSQSLTKYDIETLFRRLIKIKGNIAAATKAVNIKRKTYYDWEANSDDIKPITKRKILKACLENDPLGTIEFLFKKDELAYNELLERYLSMLVLQIVNEQNPEEVAKFNSKFESFLKAHIGSIQDSKAIIVEQTLSRINNKSKALGVTGIIDDVCFIPSTELSRKFVDLLDIFKNNPIIPCSRIANSLKLPEDFVNATCNKYGYEPTKPYSSEATRRSYNDALGVELNDDTSQPHGVQSGIDLNHLYYAKKRRY